MNCAFGRILKGNGKGGLVKLFLLVLTTQRWNLMGVRVGIGTVALGGLAFPAVNEFAQCKVGVGSLEVGYEVEYVEVRFDVVLPGRKIWRRGCE